MTEIIHMDPDYITSLSSTTPKSMLLATAADAASAIQVAANLKRKGFERKRRNRTTPELTAFRDGILTYCWLITDTVAAGYVFDVTDYSLEFVQEWALKTLRGAGVTNDDFVECQRWWNRRISPVRMVA